MIKMHGKTIKIIIAILVVLAIILGIYLGKTMFLDPATDNATERMMTEIVTSNMSEEDAAKANRAISKMSDVDKEEVKEIVNDCIEIEDAPKLAEYYQNGETDKIIAYANEHMTEEQKERLIKIYEKYK